MNDVNVVCDKSSSVSTSAATRLSSTVSYHMKITWLICFFVRYYIQLLAAIHVRKVTFGHPSTVISSSSTGVYIIAICTHPPPQHYPLKRSQWEESNHINKVGEKGMKKEKIKRRKVKEGTMERKRLSIRGKTIFGMEFGNM